MAHTPPRIVALPVWTENNSHTKPLWTDDDAVLARSLFTTWAARTGRTLRDVPVNELTPGELIEFWADDQLETLPEFLLNQGEQEM